MENFFEYYYLNVIENINTIAAKNISVNTTLKCYYSQDLNEKPKLMGRAMKCFSKKLLGYEIFSYMVCWTAKFYLKNLEKPLAPLLHT